MILTLDISTTCIGLAVFNEAGQLIDLSHISPKGSLFEKAKHVKERLSQYSDITAIAIESPLMGSNNINTVSTLLRFNGMVSLICYELFDAEPEYISTYEARKHAFPDLMQKGKSGKVVLFGGYPSDVDKKEIIRQRVSEVYPSIQWEINRNGKIKKEMFDRSDSVCIGLAYLSLKRAG